MSDYYIGIDFGTSFSSFSAFKDGELQIIPDCFGEKLHQSCITFNEKDIFFGNLSKKLLSLYINSSIYNILQLIGKNYKDKYIEEKKKYWPFKLLEDTNNNRYKISININNEEKEFTIEEILGLIFINIRNICSNYLKVEIKDVVVSIPSCFNNFSKTNH